jgi:hypothetical protein
VQREAGSLVQPVEFVVIGGVGSQVRVSLFDDHVASGAGAASSARVLDMHAEVDGDIQNGFGLAVFIIRKLSGLEFDSLPLRQKGNFGHILIVSCGPLSYWYFHVSRS